MTILESPEPPAPMTPLERNRASRGYKRRLRRVEERILVHQVSIEARGSQPLAPNAVLSLLEDVLATARGEVR